MKSLVRPDAEEPYTLQEAKYWSSYLNAHFRLTRYWYEPEDKEPPNDNLRTKSN
jgi:hypothetical protein